MRAIALPDGLAYANLAVVAQADRVRAAMDEALRAAWAQNVKPLRWRLGRGPAIALRRPGTYQGIPIEYEGHGWQIGLDTDPKITMKVECSPST